MSAIITQTDVDKLARPHVARAWFGDFDFPDGVLYLHSGEGRLQINRDGKDIEYRGVSDPLSGRLVNISQVEEPRFGAATAVNITLTGVSRDFIAEVFNNGGKIEGRPATLYWAAFDGETQEIITSLVPLFPRGRMSAPSITWQGLGVRYVSLTIENIWASQNFAPNGRWNDADQRRRFPGDRGLQYVGVEVHETWQ